MRRQRRRTGIGLARAARLCDATRTSRFHARSILLPRIDLPPPRRVQGFRVRSPSAPDNWRLASLAFFSFVGPSGSLVEMGKDQSLQLLMRIIVRIGRKPCTARIACRHLFCIDIAISHFPPFMMRTTDVSDGGESVLLGERRGESLRSVS